MDRAISSGQIFRFGLFEADVSRSTLTRKGVRVKIQDQPFRVLIRLLENSGEIVTREELRRKLWPEGTYVDFDGSLNVILKKLRAAIDDDSDNPRFIQTVPRRGYRFIAPVSEVSQSQQPAELDGASSTAAGAEYAAQPAGVSPPRHPPLAVTVSSRRLLAILAAGLVLLILAAVAYRMRSPRPSQATAQKRVMLAILPFQNLSNDPAQDYFSDGLTEETITDLGQMSPQRLGVIARTSAMVYKHTDKTVSQIGRELGVDYILEGSVRRDGDKARISAQLIRVRDQIHLWARNYDREVKDLIEVQDDLGKAIATQVQANLTPQRESELSETRAVNPEAYDLYLRARYYWNKRTPEGIKESIGYYRQATDRDPNFAMAYAALADAYNLSNIIGPYSAKESLPLAKAAAEKAIQLDASLAEAHAALGMAMSHYDFDFPGAEREFQKALEVNPNSAYAHLFYSNCYLMPMGRVREAIAENKKALELDPLSLPINNFMAETYQLAGDYEEAYQQYQHTIAMDPTFPLAHEYYSWFLIETGKYEAAITEHQKAMLLSGASPEVVSTEAAAAFEAYRTGGPTGYWRRLLGIILEQRNKSDRSTTASNVSLAYALVGDKDSAFAWLDKAYDEREGQQITLVKAEFGWRNLHGDPRFAVFLRRMGLPE